MPTHKIYSKYAGIGNDVLQTNRISLKAKGLLGYLVSKPEGWNFSSVRIAKEIKESKKTIQSILRELELDGLLKRERKLKGRVLYHVFSSYELLKEPLVDNDSESKLLRVEKGHISKTRVLEKKRERGSQLTRDEINQQYQLMTDALTPKFIERAKKIAWVNETDIRQAAEKCFAYHLKEGKIPADWGGALYYWMSSEKEWKNELR